MGRKIDYHTKHNLLTKQKLFLNMFIMQQSVMLQHFINDDTCRCKNFNIYYVILHQNTHIHFYAYTTYPFHDARCLLSNASRNNEREFKGCAVYEEKDFTGVSTIENDRWQKTRRNKMHRLRQKISQNRRRYELREIHSRRNAAIVGERKKIHK